MDVASDLKKSPTKKQKVPISTTAATATATTNTDDDGAVASSSGALAGLTTALEEQEQVNNVEEIWEIIFESLPCLKRNCSSSIQLLGKHFLCPL